MNINIFYFTYILINRYIVGKQKQEENDERLFRSPKTKIVIPQRDIRMLSRCSIKCLLGIPWLGLMLYGRMGLEYVATNLQM